MESPDVILIPLSTAVAVLTPVIGGLVTAVVWLARWGREESRGRLDDAAKASAALRVSEQGRLDDQRSAGVVLRENQERVLPLLERCAIVLKDLGDRAAKRRLEDSDPPQALRTSWTEDTLVRAQKAEIEAAEARRALADALIPQGSKK